MCYNIGGIFFFFFLLLLDRRKAGHEVLLPLFYLKHLVGMSNLLACGAHTFVSRIEWPLRCGSRRSLLPKELRWGMENPCRRAAEAVLYLLERIMRITQATNRKGDILV